MDSVVVGLVVGPVDSVVVGLVVGLVVGPVDSVVTSIRGRSPPRPRAPDAFCGG